MSNISEDIDRISTLTKSIRSHALATAPESIGPFTQAVLYTPLGDLIRDIDPTELGLFTLVTPSKPAAGAEHHTTSTPAEIVRAEFHGATPLKRPPAQRHARQDPQRTGTGEHDPEVYARAAIKYLDRYQSIRTMPRAAERAARLIEQLAEVRESIDELSEKLNQHSDAAPAPLRSPQSLVKKEKERMWAVQNQIADLKKRKEALLKRKTVPRIPSKPKPRTPPEADEQEETFWNTPGATARTLHFTGDSLLDEEVNIGNMSVASFASPVSLRPRSTPLSRTRFADDLEPDVDETPRLGVRGPLAQARSPTPEPEPEPDEESDVERTVILRNTSPAVEPPKEEPELPPQDQPEEPTSLKAHPPSAAVETPTSAARQPKIKVTTELEHIVSKIWVTVGEVVMPGYKHSAANKPPRAKETIAQLQSLSTCTPAPTSPTASSLSSFSVAVPSAGQPTVQQVLTAHMLLALLSAPPAYALPLNRLRELLTAKSAEAGVGGSVVGGSTGTRPIYGCVAKRLLKIDRGGGEQVVKFDV